MYLTDPEGQNSIFMNTEFVFFNFLTVNSSLAGFKLTSKLEELKRLMFVLRVKLKEKSWGH